MNGNPNVGIAGVVEREAVEHRPAAVPIDDEVREGDSHRSGHGGSEDQEQDRDGPAQQPRMPLVHVSGPSHDRGKLQ